MDNHPTLFDPVSVVSIATENEGTIIEMETELILSDAPCWLDEAPLPEEDPYPVLEEKKDANIHLLPQHLLPQSREAEEALLVSLFREISLFKEPEVTVLEPDKFFYRINGLIFEALRKFYQQGRTVDLISLSYDLAQSDPQGEMSSPVWKLVLEKLFSSPAEENIKEHVRIIKETALYRSLIGTLNGNVLLAYESTMPAINLVEKALGDVWTLVDTTVVSAPVPMRDLMVSQLDVIQSAYEKKQLVTGIPSGFIDLDEMTAGFQKSDYIIIASRPSMGKTALATNIAQFAGHVGQKVLYFSPEMSRESLSMRMIGGEAGIDLHRLRAGFLGDKDWTKLAGAMANLSEANLFIDDTGRITAEGIWTRARRHMNMFGLSMIIIDYIQLLSVPDEHKSENRHREINSISKGIKWMAKDLKVPVIALSQLSRPKTKADRRPSLVHLRESGSLEEDADVVIMIYREDYYNKTDDNLGIAELIIAKQRNGPTGSVKLAFLAEFTRFENLETRRLPM